MQILATAAVMAKQNKKKYAGETTDADRQNRVCIKVNIYRASTENGDITMGVILDVTRAGHTLFTEYVMCHVQAGIFQISETVELFSQQQYYGG